MLKKTDRTICIAGVPREIWVTPDGREFVEQDGDYIYLQGAKMFKTATSRNYPLPAGAKQLADEVRAGGTPFFLLPEDEQKRRLEKLFLGILDATQPKVDDAS